MSGVGPEDAAATEDLRIDVVRGAPTEEELAALVAVVGDAAAQEAAEAEAARPTAPSGWDLDRRGLRAPLRRDLDWGRFGG